ncbi:MAG: M56 family metallopeptidase [Synechococcales bacterium]|nr:M56 family metallopeptidase [Synechococcales bacterium]
MMHLGLMVVVVAIAWGIRQCWCPAGTYAQRWQQAQLAMLLPGLLLLMTALAIACMGYAGQMVTYWEGMLTYGVAWGFLGTALGWLVVLAVKSWRSAHCIRSQPQQTTGGYSYRLLATDLPYSAQIGFWQPDLVVSQGLIELLDDAHLQAVLAHEAGHGYYRDTFWFFWLGWLRRLTAWLPHSQPLWQELVLLREIRADRWATQAVDSLTLAESLVQVAQAPLMPPHPAAAAFSCSVVGDRMAERIDALLTEAQPEIPSDRPPCLWLLVAVLPLLLVPFHH